MKKILFSALAALFAVSAFAANPDEPVYTSDNGKFTFDIFSHMGYGYHAVKSDAFKASNAGEFFFNIVKFGVYPTEHLGLELGGDFEVNYFRSKKTFFGLDSKNLIQVVDFSDFEIGKTLEKPRGGFSLLTFNFPLMVKGIFNDFEVGVGAEASLDFLGETNISYEVGNTKTQIQQTDAEVNLFSYGVIATVAYDGMGLYFKYYPKGSKILPDGSVDLNFITVGVAFDF